MGKITLILWLAAVEAAPSRVTRWRQGQWWRRPGNMGTAASSQGQWSGKHRWAFWQWCLNIMTLANTPAQTGNELVSPLTTLGHDAVLILLQSHKQCCLSGHLSICLCPYVESVTGYVIKGGFSKNILTASKVSNVIHSHKTSVDQLRRWKIVAHRIWSWAGCSLLTY